MKKFVFVKRFRPRKDERGVAALEFAILAPVFMLLIFAALELSVAMHNGNTAKWAVQKASRDVLVDNTLTQPEIQTLVDGYLTDVSSKASITIAYSVDSTGTVPVGTISGAYAHQIEVPFLANFTARFPVSIAVPHAS